MSTVFVEYHWAEPEPEIVAQKLMTVAAALERLEEPLQLSGEITRADIQENFQTETDPSGTPWEEWAESYEPWARAHGSGQILTLYGHLRAALNSPSAFDVVGDGLFLDTSDLPEYWAWNNFGAPERKTKSLGTDVFGAIQGENPLPERPFIGLSPEARAKIDAMFAAWADGTISIVMSGRGSKIRGAGGRFVKMF